MCTFCVMRRTTNGGMRLVSPERVMELVPEHARRVGLVGAAVTDHPKIVDIVRQLVESGRGVGISSLRADRLTPEFVELLLRGGYRTLTIASDDQELAGCDIPHILGADQVERTGFRTHDRRVAKGAEHERPKAVRVADGDQILFCEEHQRKRTTHLCD